MPQFRKKPVVIEAVQVTSADYNGSTWDGFPFSDTPLWLLDALDKQIVTVHPSDTDYALWRINTLEDGPNGEAAHIASPGDWIIQGVQGELYACKPDIFEATYEAVKENIMDNTTKGIHPAPTVFTQDQIEADNILHFFHYAHLPETLQATSRPFCLLAEELVNTLPRCAERSVALRKLLEAKDAAVRANVGMPAPRETTFLDRLITERNEVQTRLEGLTKFLDAPKKPEVNEFQYGMLFDQVQAMRNYVDILNARIDDLLEVPGEADNPAFKENPSPKFTHPDDIEDATVEPVEVGNHDIDRDGPIPFNG